MKREFSLDAVNSLHENALVAWDRDVAGRIWVPDGSSITPWITPIWYKNDANMREDGLGVVYWCSPTSKEMLGRLVLHLSDCGLGVAWWIDPANSYEKGVYAETTP